MPNNNQNGETSDKGWNTSFGSTPETMKPGMQNNWANGWQNGDKGYREISPRKSQIGVSK